MRSGPYAVITLVALCLGSGFAAAQSSGEGASPITLVVPFGPGSGTDVVARSLAKELSVALERPVLVENKPGANGAIGAQAVAQAPADGRTLLVGSATTNAANFAFFPGKLGYQPGSFTMVGGLAASSIGMHVAAGSPWQSVQDLVASAKAGKARLNCGSGNAVTQVACEVFIHQTGLDAVTVPYKSNAQALNDVVGGQIHFAFSDTGASTPLVSGRRLRILGLASAEPNRMLGPIPTLAEQGVAQMDFTAWTALFAPVGTPPALLNRLHMGITRWQASPETLQLRARTGTASLRLSQDESRHFYAAEVARWARYVHDTRVQPE